MIINGEHGTAYDVYESHLLKIYIQPYKYVSALQSQLSPHLSSIPAIFSSGDLILLSPFYTLFASIHTHVYITPSQNPSYQDSGTAVRHGCRSKCRIFGFLKSRILGCNSEIGHRCWESTCKLDIRENLYVLNLFSILKSMYD